MQTNVTIFFQGKIKGDAPYHMVHLPTIKSYRTIYFPLYINKGNFPLIFYQKNIDSEWSLHADTTIGVEGWLLAFESIISVE